MSVMKICILCLSVASGTSQMLEATGYYGNGQCRQGWAYAEGTCIDYSDFPSTWAEAQSICSSTGSKLIEVDRPKLNSDLKTYAMQWGAECVWLGGADIFKQLVPPGTTWGGNWRWVTSGRPMYEFQDWASGQPYNRGAHENCLALSERLGYQWNPFSCNQKCHFVCQTRS